MNAPQAALNRIPDNLLDRQLHKALTRWCDANNVRPSLAQIEALRTKRANRQQPTTN